MKRTLIVQFFPDAGLGNQLLEYAAGYSIARTLGMELKCMWKPGKRKDREFGLHHFGIQSIPYSPIPLIVNRPGQGSRETHDETLRVIAASTDTTVAICSPSQDEACFIDHADEIRELFKLEPFDLPHPEGTTPVGVQVRRGDYVKHSRLSVTTPEYFLGAMDWMRAKVERPHFIVVSDDPEYCHKLFQKQVDVTVMPSQAPIDGLRTMASCKAHIISNSTFGWWGAWLGESGPVVVPEYWHHQPGSYGNWNPVPDRWVKLPVGTEQRRTVVEAIKPRVVVELPEPKVERAIVFPWHADQAVWQELRFSLRSIYQHFEDKHCPIFIFGTRRPGFINEKDPRVQYRGAYTYSEALSGGAQVANEVAWFNDDTILLKPTTWSDISVPYYLKDVGPEFLKNAVANSNPWREGCVRVLRQLQKMGITDQKVFSTHLPYVWQRKRALEVFEKFGVWEKFPMELAYFHLFPEGAKLLTTERTQELPNSEARFLNYADRHLDEDFKAEIMRLFPDPAPWENFC